MLTVSSLGFLFILDIHTFFFILALTFITFFSARVLIKSPSTLRFFLSIIVILNILLYFKYFPIFINNFNSEGKFINFNFFIPIGISYITFKHISFLVDLYWGKIELPSFHNFLLYSVFFPIFIAGPIERFENFNPQIGKYNEFSWTYFEDGYLRIVSGLLKKFVLADGLAIISNRNLLGDLIPSVPTEVVNLLLFSLQIYFDFAAYSDLAIGVSSLYGIKIMENFNNPYLKSNISLFWNSWHISLSSWLRDYIFYPLSFSLRGYKFQQYLTPIITMLICGLWHGATKGFIIWGLWHGVALMVFQKWATSSLKKKVDLLPGQNILNLASIALTFTIVTIGWWWFR